MVNSHYSVIKTLRQGLASGFFTSIIQCRTLSSRSWETYFCHIVLKGEMANNLINGREILFLVENNNSSSF